MVNNVFEISNSDEFFIIPNNLPDGFADAIVKQYSPNEQNAMQSSISGWRDTKEGDVDTQYRDSKNFWLPTDSWVAGIMAHFAQFSNEQLFKFDLSGWSDTIQYTIYDKKGSHYKWHIDTQVCSFRQNHVRKLTVVTMLTSPDDYTGGDLQIQCGAKLASYRLDKGSTIVFPSTLRHRVRPVTSGVRKTLVGWYGGPRWR